MSKSLIEVLTNMEAKQKKLSMKASKALEEVLAQYETKEQETKVESAWTEADYELNEYLNGDGDVTHLYNYYDLSSNG